MQLFTQVAECLRNKYNASFRLLSRCSYFSMLPLFSFFEILRNFAFLNRLLDQRRSDSFNFRALCNANRSLAITIAKMFIPPTGNTFMNRMTPMVDTFRNEQPVSYTLR